MLSGIDSGGCLTAGFFDHPGAPCTVVLGENGAAPNESGRMNVLAGDAEVPLGQPVESASVFPTIVGCTLESVDANGVPSYHDLTTGTTTARPGLACPGFALTPDGSTNPRRPSGTPARGPASGTPLSAAEARSFAPPATPGTPFSDSGLNIDSPLASLKAYVRDNSLDRGLGAVNLSTGGPARRTKAKRTDHHM